MDHGAALKTLRPITYRAYVQRGLDLANWDGEDLATFYRLEKRLLVGGDWDAGTSILQPRERDERDRYSGQFYRDILIRELASLLDPPPPPRPRNAEPGVKTPLDALPSFSRERYARSRDGYVAAILVASQDGAGTKFEPVLRPAHLHAALDAVMWLVTATDQPFRSELRQCAWQGGSTSNGARVPGCFNFFLQVKPKAGPRIRYCSPECREAWHQHTTPERKAAAKAGLTVAAYRNKQSATGRRSRIKR